MFETLLNFYLKGLKMKTFPKKIRSHVFYKSNARLFFFDGSSAHIDYDKYIGLAQDEAAKAIQDDYCVSAAAACDIVRQIKNQFNISPFAD